MLEIVRTCLVRALKLDAAKSEAVCEETTAADLSEWTSVAHLSLILELETALGITFEDEEVASLGSVSAILTSLSAKNVTPAS